MFIKYKVGSIIENNKKEKFIIKKISKDSSPKFTIESIDTKFTTIISRSTLYSKKFDDKLKCHNKYNGIIGNINVNLYPDEYSLWLGMMCRCYDKNHHAYKWYGESGIYVCERWHRFDYFVEDIIKIPGYNNELFHLGLLELDKDLSNKKYYSLSTCQFVSAYINKINTRRNKEFLCKFPDGEIKQGKIIKDFAEQYGFDPSAISKCLKGKIKSTLGCTFKYC